MHPIVEATGHRGLAICANGALIYDLETEQITKEHTLDHTAAAALARALRDEIPDLVFAIERGNEFGHEPNYKFVFAPPANAIVADVEQLLVRPVAKLLARHPEMTSDELMARAREAAGETATVTHSSANGLVEISGAGVSKAFALEELAAERNIKAEEVMAFGDMPNDLPMLAWAGHGVAVANAHPDVLDVADEVTASNDDDGVALVLERLLN
jgi:Cof subfamily protein (haloacid dehalogenase superfamily)